MKLTIEPTDRTVEIVTGRGTVPARVWQGTTEDGVEAVLLVTRVATAAENDQAAFVAALDPQPAGVAASEAFPARMVL